MGNPDCPDIRAEAPQEREIEHLDDAQDANVQEHNLGFFQALKLYPTGVFWSIVMSTAVIMEGYDTKLIGTLIAQPAFQKRYGQLVKPGSYQISAPWQTGLSNGATGGQLIGLLLAGYLSERFGFRKTMMAGLTIIIAFIFMTFFAPNIAVLEAGQTLFGMLLVLSSIDLFLICCSRNSLRSISDHSRHLRPRDLSIMPSSLPNKLCQLLLGKLIICFNRKG